MTTVHTKSTVVMVMSPREFAALRGMAEYASNNGLTAGHGMPGASVMLCRRVADFLRSRLHSKLVDTK